MPILTGQCEQLVLGEIAMIESDNELLLMQLKIDKLKEFVYKANDLIEYRRTRMAIEEEMMRRG